MRHAKAYRKFSRTPSHRKAMFRNMSTELIRHEKIETTVGKAKDLRSVVEKLITIGGEDTLANRRKAYSYIMDKAVVRKLFEEIGPRYKERTGGYTRVLRTRTRVGDAAEMAIIELVKEEFKANPKKNKKKAEVLPLEVAAEAAPSKEEAAKEEAAEAVEESKE